MILSPSELILNPDGSIYHLQLLPHEIAQDIITVGDPDRIDSVIQGFDNIEFDRRCREFRTVTGHFNNKRLTVISTGIGTDNIDIVFNELDALANIDFDQRKPKTTHTSLRFYRIGTSGCLQSSIPVDSLLISRYAIGLGGLAHYYAYESTSKEDALTKEFEQVWPIKKIAPYASSASPKLIQKFEEAASFLQGITLTAPGFYGPQGRNIRGKTRIPSFDILSRFSWDEYQLTNLEMETAGIYLLANQLGHEAISCNALLANRANGEFSTNPRATVEKLIERVLQAI